MNGAPSRDIRSLVVFHNAGFGGPMRSLGGATAWLSAHGTVEFIVPGDGAAAASCAGAESVTVGDYGVLTYARGPRALARALSGLRADVRFFRRELRRRQPDLVVAVTTVLPALLIAARKERVATVVYAAELYGQRWKRSPPLRVWGALLARMTVRLSDGMVSCSERVARQFPRSPAKPHAVAYPPIAPDSGEGDRAAARERYGLADDEYCVAVVGNLSRGRGQDVAVQALQAIRERVPGARLLIVGAAHPRAVDRAFERELRDLARAAGDDAVIFAPPTDSVADVYAAADVVANPARTEEAFGRVAAEALVAGRPVVASRVGAIPEVVRDGRDALLVGPGDPAALADAVSRLHEDGPLAERLVESGRARVLERFTPAQDAIAWSHVLEAVMARPRERRSPGTVRAMGDLQTRSRARERPRDAVRRVVDSRAWWWLTRRAGASLVPAGGRRRLRVMADRVGWWWLRRLPGGELKARERASWRAQSPTSGLTWAAEVTGDAFIEKARGHGLRGTVLEIGPGYGRLPEAALRLGVPFTRWIGIDLSPQNVEHLAGRFDDDRFRFVAEDAETLKLDEPVDTIVSSLTLKHVFPSFEALLRNVASNLRSEGVVIVDLIEGEHLRHFEPLRGNFIRSYGRAEIEAIFDRCGLAVDTFDHVDHSPAPEHRRLLVVGRRSD